MAKKEKKRKNKKLPKDLSDEIKALKASAVSVEANIKIKQAEAARLIDSEAIDLLDILTDQVNSGGFEVFEKSGEIIFRITFNRAEITGRPDANTALANIKEYAKAAGIDVVKGDK